MGTPLEELFSAFHRDVYTYLFSLCRDAALAEDLTGETFLEAVRSFASFRGEADCKTWLFAIARRRWFAWLKRKKRRPETEALSEFLECGEPGPAARADAAELFGRVRALLAQNQRLAKRLDEARVISRAKCVLARYADLSEEEAHRLIEKRAMDARITSREAALEILQNYEDRAL